jgi:auxin efflux carrier family
VVIVVPPPRGGRADIFSALVGVDRLLRGAAASTIIMGVPLLGGMYGPMSKDLLKQIVVMQFYVWYNIIIFMYEYMAAWHASSKVMDDGTKMITLVSLEKGDNVAVERAQQIAVDVKIMEVAAADEGMNAGQRTTVSASGGVRDVEAEKASLPAAPPSVRHIALMWTRILPGRYGARHLSSTVYFIRVHQDW